MSLSGILTKLNPSDSQLTYLFSQNVQIKGDVIVEQELGTVGDLTVGGNLTVSGTMPVPTSFNNQPLTGIRSITGGDAGGLSVTSTAGTASLVGQTGAAVTATTGNVALAATVGGVTATGQAGVLFTATTGNAVMSATVGNASLAAPAGDASMTASGAATITGATVAINGATTFSSTVDASAGIWFRASATAISADITLDNTYSGGVYEFSQNGAPAYAITLPAAASSEGWTGTFILASAAASAANFVSAGGALKGLVIMANAGISAPGGSTQVSFVGGTAAIGDRIRFECTGNIWSYTALSSVAGGIVVT
jgi:hypothetical protein